MLDRTPNKLSPFGWWARLAAFLCLALVGTAVPVALAWLFAPVLIHGLGPDGAANGSWLAWLLAGIGIATSLVLWIIALAFFGTAAWNLIRKGRFSHQETAPDAEQVIA